MTHRPANEPPALQTRANQRRQGHRHVVAVTTLTIIDQETGEVLNYAGQDNNACSAWPGYTARLTQNWSKNKKWQLTAMLADPIIESASAVRVCIKR